MSEPSQGGSSGGPWERKRARTRQEIQRHALRLFSEQGFHATTVDQVADAADLATSTVFRYFPTKHDLVVFDDDLLMIRPFIEVFRKQPAELGVLAALQRAVGTGDGASEQELVDIQTSARLVVTVPQVWAANMHWIVSSMREMAELFAERAGRDATDPEILSLTRMLCGAMTMGWLAAGRDSNFDMAAALKDAIARLETGFRL